MTSSAIVQELWNYCNVLRDDLSAPARADLFARTRRQARRRGSEQLTYLLFLFTCALYAGRKMAMSGRTSNSDYYLA